MKYEYKVIVVDDRKTKELDKFLENGREVFLVTPEVVSTGSSGFCFWCNVFHN